MTLLNHYVTENGVGFDKRVCWATASYVYCTNLSTYASISLQLYKCLEKRLSLLAYRKSTTLLAFLHICLGISDNEEVENY